MGVGAYFQKEADGKLTVKSMLTGSPSEKCGKIKVWNTQQKGSMISVHAMTSRLNARQVLVDTYKSCMCSHRVTFLCPGVVKKVFKRVKVCSPRMTKHRTYVILVFLKGNARGVGEACIHTECGSPFEFSKVYLNVQMENDMNIYMYACVGGVCRLGTQS